MVVNVPISSTRTWIVWGYVGLENDDAAAAIEDLRAEGALITEARVVDDGDILTAGGITSGIDLALWIIERYRGKEAAEKVAAALAAGRASRGGSVDPRAGRASQG